MLASPSYTLYIDDSQTLSHQEAVTFNNAPREEDCGDWVSLNARKLDPSTFAPWRWGIFHYGVSGHYLENCSSPFTSGSAEISGDDFIVTLGGFDYATRPELERNTLLHEVGHNFSLEHRGSSPAALTSTVNYQSVMSYRHQLPGLVLVSDGLDYPDYSHQRLLDLDESDLDETLGVDFNIAQGPEYFLTYEGIVTTQTIAPSTGGIDWDDDSGIDTSTVSADIDGDGRNDQLMTGRDDWNSLNLLMTCNDEHWMLKGTTTAAAGDDEIDEETAAALHVLYPQQLANIDVGPACSSNEVASNGSGKVQLALLGSATLDVYDIDLDTVRVRTAQPTLFAIEFVNGDAYDDLLMQVDTIDLAGLGLGTGLRVYAVKENSQVVVGKGSISWVSTTTDTDSDGVRNSCDSCPTVAATPPSADGCP